MRHARRWLTGFLALWWVAWAWAQVPVPPLTDRVVDVTHTLSAEQQTQLSQVLASFEVKRGTQFAVLIVSTTGHEPIEQFSLRVAEKWKIGRKGTDDGALLVVAKNDHTVRIEVGYGLEGSLTDAMCKRIIDDFIVPRFQAGDMAGGISAGIDQMVRVAEGENLPAPPASTPEGDFLFQPFAFVAFILALLVGGLLRMIMKRLPAAILTGGLVAAITWFMAGVLSVALAFGIMAMALTLGGGLGLPLRGGRNSSGGRGGGFGGGGGGFGGGGASGKW